MYKFILGIVIIIHIYRQFRSEVKLSIGDVGVLLFADDMVVMAESVEGLQSNLQVLSNVLSRWELKVN